MKAVSYFISVIVLTCVVSIIVILGIRVAFDSSGTVENTPVATTDIEVTEVKDYIVPLHLSYFKDQISLSDYELLNYLNENFKKYEKEIDVSQFDNLTAESLYRVYEILLINQLDISYTIKLSYKSQNGKVITVYPEYKDNASNLNRVTADIKDSVTSIVADINALELNTYEKVKYIHDYIIKNCKYVSTSNSNNLYGVLFQKEAVCEGYAKTFAYFCDFYDIQSVIVTGTANGNHMWNMVKIEDNWYNVDLTWDDTDDTANGGIDYTYFLVSDDKIKGTHIKDNILTYPVADMDFVI